MKRWPTKLLGDVAQVTAGDPAPQRPEDFAEDGVPFVRMQDVGRLGQSTCLAETKDRLSPSASARLKRFPAGSILVPKSGASIRLNHRAILGIEAHVVSHLAVIVPFPLLNTHFAYYWLCGTDLSGVAHQADLPSMKTSDLAKLQLPVPPLAEQERIVKLLDEADELRKLRAQADCYTDALIPSLFHEMFGDPDSNPKGWPVKTLEQLAERLHQGINTAADKVQYQSSGYPILQAKHITSGYIEIGDARFVSAEDFAKYKDRHRPSSGNILFTNIGTIGKSVVVDQTSDFLVAWNIFLIALQPDVSPLFINTFLQLLDKRGFFTGRNTGSATQFVSKRQMQAIKIAVPPLPLQKQFAARVSEIRTLQAEQTASRHRLDDLFQSMLHRAFTGAL